MSVADLSKSLVLRQQANALLGETPLWHAGEQALYWIDVLRPAVYRYDPAKGQTDNWPMPSAVGAIGLREGGGFIVACENEGISIYDPKTFEHRLVASPRKGHVGRYNDGRVDAAGRFWIGWLTHSRKETGSLYRVDVDGSVSEAMTDIVAPNGLGWSPDGQTMYITDSHINTIWACPFDPVSGKLGARRKFYEFAPREKGILDGLAVDSEGGIWIAMYNGWAVIHLDPAGKLVDQFHVPVSLLCSCTFGDADLRTLYITSSVRQQNASQLANQPWAGALMSVRMPVAGMKEPMVRM